ncbi:MAG: PEP-CTERM sorting domain-containing protein [Burkholderiales bacterium]
MKRLAQHIGLLAIAFMVAAPSVARADVVLMGSDYFETIPDTFFLPLTQPPLNLPSGALAGLPIGPGSTDTIVRRLDDCMIGMAVPGSQCVIPIEMVALSLVSVVNPMVVLRESPTQQSFGQMTIISDGSGSGGTFDSFFDIFVDLSIDGGMNFMLLGPPIHLESSGTSWTTQPQGIVVPGPVGDGEANLHVNPGVCAGLYAGMPCFDFFVAGQVTESHPLLGQHTARSAVPEPGTLALCGLALWLLARRRSRPQG